MRVTNLSDVSLTLAVWLLSDDYDYNSDPNYISVTGLLKPTRMIILGSRVEQATQQADVLDYVARKRGHALHDSIEKAWVNRNQYERALKLMGYPEKVIDLIMINPTWEEIDKKPDGIPVYLEQRHTRQINGRTIGGKFDMVAEGRLQDNKSTSAMSWVYGTRDDEHQMQMSLYRWIDAGQDRQKITEDDCLVNYIFTDWAKFSARTNPKYPQKPVEKKMLPLLSVADTEKFVVRKLDELKKYWNVREVDVPECTPEEMWMSAPTYAYFSDPTKTDGKSTKNFETLQEANAFAASKGKGVVQTRPAKPKRCEEYCPAFSICTQKDRYFG
jgi:hypothetical protein